MTALDDFFTSFWRRHPVTATFAGEHTHDALLPDWSPAGLESTITDLRAQRTALAAEQRAAASTLGSAAWPEIAPLVDLRLAGATVAIELSERTGAHFHRGNPSLAVGEAVFGVISLMIREFAPLHQRIASATARLLATPAFLAGARASITRPIPRSWAERAQRECDGAVLLLDGGISRWLASAPVEPALAGALRDAAGPATAAFDDFATWLRGGAQLDDNGQIGCGAEMLDAMIAIGHACDTPRAELLADAHQRFASALGALAGMAIALAPGGWTEVQAQLADDHPTLDEYLPAFGSCRDACRAKAEKHDVVTWPEAHLRFAPTPEWTRDAAPLLYYLPYRCPPPLEPTSMHTHAVPPVDDGIAPAEQERRLRITNHSVIKLNHVVHHAAIGHHVQNWYAARSASRVGRVAAVDGASRIAMFCGGSLAEGWACYATDVMTELGFCTPLERVAEQHTTVRMLARTIVDIELHQGTMTLDEAAAFYAERALMPAAAARAEAVKNSMFPGAALMYWLGTDGVHRLRVERALAEGTAFSLRTFHDTLLGFGAIPVSMIAALMNGRAIA